MAGVCKEHKHYVPDCMQCNVMAMYCPHDWHVDAVLEDYEIRFVSHCTPCGMATPKKMRDFSEEEADEAVMRTIEHKLSRMLGPISPEMLLPLVGNTVELGGGVGLTVLGFERVELDGRPPEEIRAEIQRKIKALRSRRKP